GKSLAGRAGARRLDGRVQREQIGLTGDRLNEIDDVADSGSSLRQLADARIGLLRLIDRFAGNAGGSRDLAADLADRGGQLFAGGRDGMNVGGGFARGMRSLLADLLDGVGRLAQRGRGGFELASRGRNQIDDLADLALELVGEP